MPSCISNIHEASSSSSFILLHKIKHKHIVYICLYKQDFLSKYLEMEL